MYPCAFQKKMYLCILESEDKRHLGIKFSNYKNIYYEKTLSEAHAIYSAIFIGKRLKLCIDHRKNRRINVHTE